MKLKTLKDLRESVFKAKDEENILFINNFTSKKQPHLFDRFPAGHLIEYKESIVFYNDLKQEAIKWIKELRKRREPEITSHSTDVIEDFDVERIIEKSGTKTGSVYCKKCGKMLWASYNEIMQTMVETDDGFYCVKCFKLEEVNEKGLSENILVRWIKHFFNITEEDLK